jgi:hypothetical protein
MTRPLELKVVPGNPLRMGKTRSCGCLHKEFVAQQASIGGCRAMDESVVREGEFRVCATLRRRAPEVSSAGEVFGTPLRSDQTCCGRIWKGRLEDSGRNLFRLEGDPFLSPCHFQSFPKPKWSGS